MSSAEARRIKAVLEAAKNGNLHNSTSHQSLHSPVSSRDDYAPSLRSFAPSSASRSSHLDHRGNEPTTAGSGSRKMAWPTAHNNAAVSAAGSVYSSTPRLEVSAYSCQLEAPALIAISSTAKILDCV